MSKGVGNSHGLYLANSEPSTPYDPADYEQLGFSTDLSFPRALNLIDASDKDSEKDSEYRAGRRNRTVEGTVFRNVAYQDDAGQQILEAKYNATAPRLWWLITDIIDGNALHYGEGFVSQADVALPDEGIIEMSVTIQVTGIVTRDAYNGLLNSDFELITNNSSLLVNPSL